MKSHQSKDTPRTGPVICTAAPDPMVAPLSTRTLETAAGGGETGLLGGAVGTAGRPLQSRGPGRSLLHRPLLAAPMVGWLAG